MQTVQRTFFENALRYLEPIFLSPRVTIKSFIIYSIWAISPIVHIIFIQLLVAQLEIWNRDMFLSIMLYYVAYNIAYEILNFSMRKWWWVENINQYRKIIDRRYIKRFVRTNNNEIEKQGTGKLVSIVTNGSDVWALSLDSFLLEMTRILYVFGFACYMIFSASFLYGVGFLILYIVVAYAWAYFNSLSLIARRKRLELWHSYIRSFVRILMSKIEIMQSSKTQTEIQRVNDISDDIIEINKEMATRVHFCYSISESSVIWAKIGILLYVWLWVFEGVFSLAFFVWLFGVMALMESTITQSMKFFRNFTRNFTVIEALWNFFDTTPEIQGYEKWKKFSYRNGNITLSQISYEYEEWKTVFQDFDLEIQGWQVTALVWPSGWWKSTLVKLISWYIRQDGGSILVDAQNLHEVSLKSYYADIGYLTQDPSVFDGTVRENLLYSMASTPTKQQLEKIIGLAHCEFIYDLKNGLDTEIWERWVKLSWGQKQRLAIAKIFLKNPNIIILDEPTSALDSLSEKKITEAMHNLFQSRTVIVIAHRLQTVKYADDIIVIDDGGVVERWTHITLIKKRGYYKQMLDLQSGF